MLADQHNIDLPHQFVVDAFSKHRRRHFRNRAKVPVTRCGDNSINFTNGLEHRRNRGFVHHINLDVAGVAACRDDFVTLLKVAYRGPANCAFTANDKNTHQF